MLKFLQIFQNPHIKFQSKPQKSAFSLLEILVALLIVGILGGLSGAGIFGLYKNYQARNIHYELQISTLNTLAQIQNILKDSLYLSIALDFALIPSNFLSLKSHHLNFIPKIHEKILFDAYALPCFSGFLEPSSLKISSSFEASLALIDTKAQNPLNQNCQIYHHPNLEAIFINENFLFPQDFYNPVFRAKVLELKSAFIKTQIPPFLQNLIATSPTSPTTNPNTSPLAFISPKFYLSKEIQSLSLNQNTLTLHKNTQNLILDSKVSDFLIAQKPFGIVLKVCKEEQNLHFCAEALLLKESL